MCAGLVFSILNLRIIHIPGTSLPPTSKAMHFNREFIQIVDALTRLFTVRALMKMLAHFIPSMRSVPDTNAMALGRASSGR